MKKECAICNKKQGFLSVSFALKGGECVCSSCLETLSITSSLLSQATFSDDFKRIPLNAVKQAFNGDITQMLGLSSKAIGRAISKKAMKATGGNTINEPQKSKRNVKAKKGLAQQAGADGLVYNFDGGAGDILLVYDDRITIRRKGLSNIIIMGLKGEKTIYFSDLTSIQFRKAGLVAGYIQFSLPGGNESKGGVWDAVDDENTITLYADKNDEAEEVVNYLNTQLRKIKSPQSQQATTVVNQVSTADELMKFKNLLDAGVLTQDEFDKKKSELLNL